MKLWKNLPDNARGALWIIMSGLFFSLMAVGVRSAGKHLPSVEIVFFRTVFQLLLISPLIIRSGVASLHTDRFKLHLLRAVLGAATVQCTFYALTQLPLADATAISFSRSLFLTLLAAIILKEAVGRHRWSAALIGFIGVLIVVQPEAITLPTSNDSTPVVGATWQFATIVAVVGALMSAAMSVTLRLLSSTEHNAQIMLFPALLNLLISTPLAMSVWESPAAVDIYIIAAASCAGFCGQWCLIEGFRAGEASALAPINYLRIIYASLFGFIFFGEIPGINTIVGAIIITAAALYIIRRESIRKRSSQ